MLHFLLFIITIILLWILDIPGKSLSCGMCLIIFSTAKEYSMGTTQPIRNKDELAAFRMYYKDIHPNRRNYCLIVMGLNTALRISDLLRLKWDNVYNYTCRYQPISRTQAYRIVKTASDKTVQDEKDEIYLKLEL